MTTTNDPRTTIGTLLAALTVLLAALGLPALAGEEGEKDEKHVKIEKIIRLGGGEGCEEGEDCNGFVWMMKDDSDDPDGPQVHMMPLHGMLQRGWLGVGIMDLNRELLDHYRVPSDGGVLVSKVEKDSPAERAGIRVGDIIAGVDGKALEGPFALQSAIAARENGDVVRLEVWRDGRSLDIDATIEQRKRGQFDMSELLVGPEHGGQFLFRMDPEALAGVQKRLKDVFEDDAIRQKLHGQLIEEEELRSRLQELERRLAEMHERLERALGDSGRD